MWEELRFHDMKYQEDVDEISDKLTKVYRQLIRHGLIVAGNACDERSLVIDLNEKIPEGTEMRRWFYSDDNKLDIPNFGSWINYLLRWRLILPRRHKEQAFFGDEGEGEADGQYGAQDGDDLIWPFARAT